MFSLWYDQSWHFPREASSLRIHQRGPSQHRTSLLLVPTFHTFIRPFSGICNILTQSGCGKFQQKGEKWEYGQQMDHNQHLRGRSDLSYEQSQHFIGKLHWGALQKRQHWSTKLWGKHTFCLEHSFWTLFRQPARFLREGSQKRKICQLMRQEANRMRLWNFQGENKGHCASRCPGFLRLLLTTKACIDSVIEVCLDI